MNIIKTIDWKLYLSKYSRQHIQQHLNKFEREQKTEIEVYY